MEYTVFEGSLKCVNALKVRSRGFKKKVRVGDLVNYNITIHNCDGDVVKVRHGSGRVLGSLCETTVVVMKLVDLMSGTSLDHVDVFDITLVKKPDLSFLAWFLSDSVPRPDDVLNASHFGMVTVSDLENGSLKVKK